VVKERPGTHCAGGWMSPRAGLDGCVKSRLPPEFDPRTVQPVASRYTDWAIPAHKYAVRVSNNETARAAAWLMTQLDSQPFACQTALLHVHVVSIKEMNKQTNKQTNVLLVVLNCDSFVSTLQDRSSVLLVRSRDTMSNSKGICHCQYSWFQNSIHRPWQETSFGVDVWISLHFGHQTLPGYHVTCLSIQDTVPEHRYHVIRTYKGVEAWLHEFSTLMEIRW
jgi:hypothetical protein